ncbi:MAG: DUF4105 domain-containing protein [Proteobacteria bacterium]|nr:DUF4105 domain-containing protein [Pseudomonadota bacterium]
MITGRGSPFLLTVFLVILLFDGISSGKENHSYVEELIQKASVEKLSEDRYWYILMHYQKGIRGVKSLIDDPSFFLSENGKTSPKEELEAAIRLFFSDKEEDHSFDICEFFARYTWLKQMIDVDMKKVYPCSCQAVLNVNPQSATVVFPSYYMNNPASMFGHTFINIRTGFKSDHLANTINYSARTDETNGIVFSVKGIFGMYKGYYSVLPYYKKILEYNDMDKRDIWEYELNLTPEELEKMVFHIRELEGKYTDYYFFDENCSYNLLFLLEAARPSVHLTDRFLLSVIPIDTVKAMKEEGLIQSVNFRPSKVTSIQEKAEAFTPEAWELANQILDKRISPENLFHMAIKTDEKAAILDFASEYIQYQYLKKEIESEDYRKRLLSVLKVRSRLGKRGMSPPSLIPRQPEKAHDSTLVSVGGGTLDGEGYAEIAFRPALNEICDPDFPDDNGMQIKFLDTRMRYWPDDDSATLEGLDVVNVRSLSSRSDLFKPVSWMFRTGLKRNTLEDKDRKIAYYVNSGVGVSYFKPITGLFYLLAAGELDLDNAYQDGYQAGAGFESGLIRRICDPVKIQVSGTVMKFFPGDHPIEKKISITGRIRISRNLHLALEASLNDVEDDSYQEFSGGVNCYF